MRSSRSMMPGAASHISFTGGWLARKSPPYTVSSKCCQVESPSPLRFFAALMPPWAHTECERLTGTMENRSTCPPISAILMTAERPASPPPTTMIFGLVAIKISGPGRPGLRNLCCRAQVRRRRHLRRGQKRHHRHRSYHNEHHRHQQAHHAKFAPRVLPGEKAPLGGEQPQAIAEVPRGRDDAHEVKRHCPGMVELVLHLPESGG